MQYEIFKEIAANDRERERVTLSEYACTSEMGFRRRIEKERDVRDAIRGIFFRDTDRIIHAAAYTRYVDKTQVFYLFENDHLTHRVLHVQLVAKIARAIGRALRLNEDLIEAIALGHDLGHVPYGHDGERFLNTVCRNEGVGSFAHNVQSVRALELLENKGRGLNLSIQVLDGILCHNGEMLAREYRPQYGKTLEQFDEEYRRCFEDSAYCKKVLPMTLEGCVMRISDVVAYIGRDVEDALRVNVIKKKDLPEQAVKVLGDSNDKIVNTLVSDLIEHSYGKDHLLFSAPVFAALEELKAFNFERIYSCPRIKTQDRKIRNMFDVMFKKFRDDLIAKDLQSPVYKYFVTGKNEDYIANTPPLRVVVDFIAGMTDDYFNNQFMDLFVPKSFGYSLKDL
jgi:dGTPase